MTTAIINVRVFDGKGLSAPKTVVFENGLISDKKTGDTVIDGSGCTLLPGFIDSHIHLDHIDNLKQAAQNGVTTMLDMATDSTELVNSLRHQKGLTDIQSCYEALTSCPGPMLRAAVGTLSSYVSTTAEAEDFVRAQIDKGAEYIKVILEGPPLTTEMFSAELLSTVVKLAHAHGKRVFAHTTSVAAYRLAVEAGVDVLNHIPSNELLPTDVIDGILEKGILVIPTMIMQKGIVAAVKKMMPDRAGDYSIVEQSVGILHKAGVTLIAGTDSNRTNKMNFVPHGPAMHDELELMVQAGLSPIEALQSATCVPAQKFDLKDRGLIENGRRADLLLVSGDPTVNIGATRNIKGVWIAGVAVSEGGKTL